MASISKKDFVKVASDLNQMMELSNGLEDIGDIYAATAIRVAMYDKINDVTTKIDAELTNLQSQRFASSSQETMEKYASKVDLLEKLKGLLKKPAAKLNEWLEKSPFGRKFIEPGKKSVTTEGTIDAVGNVSPSITTPAKAMQLTDWGKGTLGAAGVAGAAAGLNSLRGPRRTQQNAGGLGEISYPGGGATPAPGWPQGSGGGGYPMAPGSPMGGFGGHPAMSGADPVALQQIQGHLQGIAGKVQELDNRVRSLEMGVR